MNISVNWANYALAAGACLVGYYVVIGFIYYRKSMWRLLQAKREPASNVRQPQPVTTNSNTYEAFLPAHGGLPEDHVAAAPIHADVQPAIDNFMDEIDAYTQSCGNHITKDELGIHLRQILHKYPSLTNSSLQGVLTGIITTVSLNNCSIQWQEDELNEWWNG